MDVGEFPTLSHLLLTPKCPRLGAPETRAQVQVVYVVSDAVKPRWGNGEPGQGWEGSAHTLAMEPGPRGRSTSRHRARSSEFSPQGAREPRYVYTSSQEPCVEGRSSGGGEVILAYHVGGKMVLEASPQAKGCRYWQCGVGPARTTLVR